MSATECRVCGEMNPVGHDCKANFDSLRAENERLQRAVTKAVGALVEHPCYKLSKDLEADNARLREALALIIDSDGKEAGQLRDIAFTALSEEGKE